MLIHDMEAIWECRFPKRSRQCYVIDQDERQTDGSRHWDSIKSVLARKFACEGTRDFSDEDRFLTGGTKKKLNTAEIKMEFCVIYELFKDTLVAFRSSQNCWVMYLSLAIGKGTYFIEDFHGTSGPYWEMDLFREDWRKIKPVRQSF